MENTAAELKEGRVGSLRMIGGGWDDDRWRRRTLQRAVAQRDLFFSLSLCQRGPKGPVQGGDGSDEIGDWRSSQRLMIESAMSDQVGDR